MRRIFVFLTLINALAKAQDDAVVIEAPTIDHALYLIGDAGSAGDAYSGPVMDLLVKLGKSDGAPERTVVFLGDNIYPVGMHRAGSPYREHDEEALDAQIQAAKAITEKVIFIPGNHDWRQTKEYGLDYVRRQEKYVESKIPGDSFQPDNGCPGPTDEELGDQAALIILDTQWWLHPFRKGQGIKDGCEASSTEDVLRNLDEMMKDNRNKRIIVVGHHPFVTYGPHGGVYKLRDHFFPLLGLNKNLWIPLPVIGSIYPLYRTLLGNVQDMPHGDYIKMRTAIIDILEQFPGTVYAAGHEHNLQYTEEDSIHYVVSGSGCKISYLGKSHRLEYGELARGFSRINIMTDGSMELEFFTVQGGERPTYKKWIADPNPFELEQQIAEQLPAPTLWELPDSITVIPNENLGASRSKRFWFGDLYRDVWTAPITVPVVNMDTAYGGVVPEKLGGGQQTRSLDLRSKHESERYYTFRSIRKFPKNALDRGLRESFAKDVVADGIAGSMPYGALAIPTLSRSLGLLHTSPQLVYVPETDQLKEYKTIYGNTLALMEEEPEGARSMEPNLGATNDLIDSGDLIKKLAEQQDVLVNDEELLRARLLDVIIGDWDRHDGQWAWAGRDSAGSTIYDPVAQDRDQAFFRLDGFFPKLVNRKWAQNKLQSFGPTVHDMDGLTKGARVMDRAYLNQLERKDWVLVTEHVQHELTDAVIKKAVDQLPPLAVQMEGEFLRSSMQARRENLPALAELYYSILAKQVDVVGSNKNELFEVERIDDQLTRVRRYALGDSTNPVHDLTYERTFHGDETKEIRLYGLGGNDRYEVRGQVKKGIKIRIIAGFEKDEFVDSSKVGGLRRKTIIHDTYAENKVALTKAVSKETKVILEREEDALFYNRDGNERSKALPMLRMGYNVDDGGYFGLGLQYTKFGFNTDPFRTRHIGAVNYALGTGTISLMYHGNVPKLFGDWGLGIDALLRTPDHAQNFFGYGNRTLGPDEVDFSYPITVTELKPFAQWRLTNLSAVRVGLSYFNASVNKSANSELGNELTTGSLYPDVTYIGSDLGFSVANLDDELDPGRGIKFRVDLDWAREMEEQTDMYGVGSEVSMYIPLTLFPGRTVWAIRGGAHRRYGSFDPTQANSIGGDTFVRGMRRNRFSGNSNAYFNTELRIDLIDVKRTKVIPFRLGLITFFDGGRVWVDNVKEKELHYAYGAGLFLRPLKLVAFTGTYGISDNDRTFELRMGFFF